MLAADDGLGGGAAAAAAPKLEEDRKEVGDWRVEDCEDEEREVSILVVFLGGLSAEGRCFLRAARER